MIRVISKKEYKDLWSIVDKQDKQIEELIGMVREAQARATHATKCYCDLAELVDEHLQSLPQEAIDLVHEIRKLMTKDQG